MKRNSSSCWNLLDRLYPVEARRRSAAIGLLLGILAPAYFLLVTPEFEASKTGIDVAVLEQEQANNERLPSAETLEEEEKTEPSPRTVDLTMRRGDTLLGMLMQHGLDSTPANDLVNKLQTFYDPKRVRPGDSFRLLFDAEGNAIQGLEYSVSGAVVRVLSTEQGWVAERVDIPFVRDMKVVRGHIRASLFEDGIDAGLSPAQIHNLANLFEYEIDFFSDIRRGDDFSVLFEKKYYANGEREQGKVLAAEIQAGGSPYQVFYYKGKNAKGSYYDTHGKALMKAFLRAPLSYRRISSPFSINRKHPIFRTVRPHKAIDYAAPTGTPVVTVGSGRVTFVGTRGGYGKMVEIRHDNGYVSRYAHFSKFAKGVRVGKPITQGQVVGYVGQTGHATGPHLHFEMLNKGQKINFLALKNTASERLRGAELQEFLALRDKKLPLLQGNATPGAAKTRDLLTRSAGHS
ncbi:MAG: peptidoglycan DD-metalloendopeptidase family protein [Candidatus Binatia bacterium]